MRILQKVLEPTLLRHMQGSFQISEEKIRFWCSIDDGCFKFSCVSASVSVERIILVAPISLFPLTHRLIPAHCEALESTYTYRG